MAVTLDDKLVVAISSRALFDFEEENRLFDPDHPQSYMQLQLDRLDVPARPGVAFSLVKKLLAFNEPAQQRVEVVVLSRNDPVSGMRVFRSAKAHGLASVQRGVFTQGAAPFRYLRPLGAQTGQLPVMLQRAATQLSTEVQRRAMQLATILEPLLIVAMGLIVMLIVLAVLLPIIQLNQFVK